MIDYYDKRKLYSKTWLLERKIEDKLSGLALARGTSAICDLKDIVDRLNNAHREDRLSKEDFSTILNEMKLFIDNYPGETE